MSSDDHRRPEPARDAAGTSGAPAHALPTMGVADLERDTIPWGADDPMGETRPPGDLDAAPASALAPGTRVGRYVLQERIGAGGMGVVYAAHDPELDRRVAVKLVRAAAGPSLRADRPGRSSGGASRLLREAQAMARLHHPNVIVVHDVGTVRVGPIDFAPLEPGRGDAARPGSDAESQALVFIAMEYLGGGTLRDFLEGQRRGWQDVVDRFRRAGAGLQAAHAAGIVHRDFKPENVLLGEDGRVCVVDFGLARAVGASENTTAESVDTGSLGVRLTQTGAVMGTPAYMAPEQHEGAATDAKTDQFSFCVALYEGLYGQRPFAGDTVATLAFHVLSGELRPPPAGRGVPRWLFAVVARGLSVEPGDRWPSMGALLDALGRDPVAIRRRRLRWGALALLGAGGIAATFVLATPAAPVCDGGDARMAEVWNDAARERIAGAMQAAGPEAVAAWPEAQAQLDTHARAWVAMHHAACAATRISGEQSEDLLDRRMVCLEQRRRQLDTVVQMLAGDDPDVARRAKRVVAGIDPVDDCADAEGLLERADVPDDADRERILAARQEIHRAKSLRTAVKPAEAQAILDALEPEIEALAFGPLRAEYLYIRAATAVDQRRFDEAEKLLYDAAILAAEIHEEEVAANAWTGLVRLIGIQQGRFADAEPIIKAAEAAVARVREPDYYRGALLSTSGTIAIMNERYADAEPLLREAHSLLAKTQGAEHDNTLETQEMLAVALQGQGALDEAGTILEDIVEARTRTMGAEHPALAGPIGNLGLIHAGRGDHARALELYLRCHAMLVRGFGEDHQAVVTSHLNIASAMRRLGNLDDAAERLEAALELGTRLLGADNPRVGGIHLARQQLHATRKEWDAALAAAEEAGRVYEAAYGAEHPRLADALVAQGAALVEAGRAKDAVTRLQRAHAIRKSLADGELSPMDRAGGSFELGRALWAADDAPGDRARARELVEESVALLEADVRAERPDEDAAANLAEAQAWLAAH